MNKAALPINSRPVAIVGALLVDGRSGAAVPDAAVVVRDGAITAVRPRSSETIPADADVVAAAGVALLPSLVGAPGQRPRGHGKRSLGG